MAMSKQAAWRAPQLGTQKTLVTSAGALSVHERGAGRSLVFAHGWFGNANLWRKVIDALADEFHTVALDLPLGAHTAAMQPGADLTPAGIASLIHQALASLDLKDAVLVGNDSGGAYSQIALSQDARRVAALILNACETPGMPWPPKVFDGLQTASRTPGALRQAMTPLRDPTLRMAEAAFGRLVMKPLEVTASDTYVLPLLEDDGVLADAEAVISSASGAHVEAAAARLISDFDRPVALIWPANDDVFPHDKACAYAAALRHGRYETLPGCRSFVPEDQPVVLAERIAAFAREV